MADHAAVRSVDALESFRASMIVFIGKARRSVDEASDELRRTRQWIQNDRRVYWEAQFKRRRTLLDQAQAELMTARMSDFIDTPSVQQNNVRKAKKAMEEAEEKLRLVKLWSRDFDRGAEPLAKKLDSLRHHLEEVMPLGVASLAQTVKILDEYSSMSLSDGAPEKPAPPVEG